MDVGNFEPGYYQPTLVGSKPFWMALLIWRDTSVRWVIRSLPRSSQWSTSTLGTTST